MTPTGRFGTPLDPLAQKHYVGLAAGSGITPVLSILETVMGIETESRFTLIYGNHTKESTMFRHDLDRLESRYADRLEILHVLSSDPRHTPELRGQIDDEKLERWLTTSLRPETVDESFLCGPIAVTAAARDTLIAHGVDENIHLELFTGYAKTEAHRDYQSATVTFTTIRAAGDVQAAVAGDSILEGALQPQRHPLLLHGPYRPLRAKLLDGTAAMDQNFALRAHFDLDARYVLTCGPIQQAPPCRSTTTHKETEMASRTTAPKAPHGWLHGRAPHRRSLRSPTRHSCATCKTRSSTFCATSR